MILSGKILDLPKDVLYTKASSCISHSYNSTQLYDTLVSRCWIKDNCFFLQKSSYSYLSKNTVAQALEQDSLQVGSILESHRGVLLRRGVSQAATWEHMKASCDAFLKEPGM